MLSYLDVHSTDPAFNLALEQYIFDALPRDGIFFLLWQNDRAVIVGRHQDALAEIDENYTRSHGIRVVRRLSGGGAVYHDLGNLNYSFIADASDAGKLDFSRFLRPVLRTLADLGIEAELNGRNDITIGGKKISGNSQYIRKGRLLQHGTILFDSDLDEVDQALCVDGDKLKTKGIRSVRSRVSNVRDHLLRDMSLEEFRHMLLEKVLDEMPGQLLELSQSDLAAVNAIRAERYDSWAWTFGESFGTPDAAVSELRDGASETPAGGVSVRERRTKSLQQVHTVGGLAELTPCTSSRRSALSGAHIVGGLAELTPDPGSGSLEQVYSAEEKTLLFTKRQRVEGCGLVEVCISLKGGRIVSAVFRGDFFSLEDPEELAGRLIGLRPESEEYARALASVDTSRYIAGLSTDKLMEILCG